MALTLMMVPKICPIFGLKTMELVKWSQRRIHGKCRTGTREIVGFGCNGIAAYKDDAHFPFPSIRFQEFNSCIDVSTLSSSIISSDYCLTSRISCTALSDLASVLFFIIT